MEVCRYFVRGYCARGDTCRFSHPVFHPPGQELLTNFTDDSRVVSTLRPEAQEFVPSKVTTPACMFFLRNQCRKGESCKFLHPVDQLNDRRGSQLKDAILLDRPNKSESSLRRQLKGTIVTFGHGAKVLDVEFYSATDNSGQQVAPHLHEKLRLLTVRCTWHNPSRIGWIQYSRKKQAEDAISILSNTKVHGRILKVGLIAPPELCNEKKRIWSVALGNLHVDTQENELRSTLKGISPRKVKFGIATSELSEQEATDLVKARLQDSGREIQSFDAVQSRTGALMKAYVRFASPSQARSALSLSGKDVPEVEPKLYVQSRVAVRISILHGIYAAIAKDIDFVRQSAKKDDVWLSDPPSDKFEKVTIRIIGSDATAVAKAKTKIELLLDGIVVLNDREGALWDDHYRSALGLAEIQDHHIPGQLFLYRDLQKEKLVFYGNPSLYADTREALKAGIQERAHCMHFISLENDDDGLCQRSSEYILVRLQNRFGKERVKLDTTRNPPYIFFSADEEEAQMAKEMVAASYLQQDSKESEPSDKCPICFLEPEDAVQLTCGHHYCLECFQGQCKAAESNQIPILCFGAAGNCKQIVSLHDLANVLPHTAFEGLLETSIEMYTRGQPERFQHCPTPDCPNIYPVTITGTVVICEQCLTAICTKCKTVNHDGISCDEARRIAEVEQQELDMQQYRNDHDARKCPQCPAIIEREDGCNHMECSNCHAHICWNRDCMQAFNTAQECYDHLERVHGAFVDAPEEFDEIEIAEQRVALMQFQRPADFRPLV